MPAFWFLCYIWFVNIPLELRTTDQITSVLTEIWSLLDSQMAFKMMQPNVVLAIAGIKPVADMCEIDPNSNTLKDLPHINKILGVFGLRLYVIIKPGEPDYYGGIESSLGLERTTNLSKFPFVIKYTNNVEEFANWKSEMKIKYQEEVNKGHYTDKEISMIKQGLEMGYPDQAIKDLLHYYKLDEEHRLNVPAYLKYIEDARVSESLKKKVMGKEIYVKARLHIPNEYLETSPLPLFSYSYNNKDNEGINTWIHDANEVLDGFYNSEWYRTHRI
jgi:hypothetical protein